MEKVAVPKNKRRIPKVGDRVTRLGDNPLRWGTVTRVTDLQRPGLKITGAKRFSVRVLWDGLARESVVSAEYLFFDGETPIQLGHPIKEMQNG
jgi:hypothetical protein